MTEGAGVRLLVINSEEEARQEMAAIGVHPDGVDIMAPKAVFRVLKLTGLTAPQANIVKQEMLAKGGEAAVAWGAVDGSAPTTDVLLMGTLRQYEALIKKLARQPYGLRELAGRIGEALINFETRPRYELSCRGYRLPLGRRTLVMGILNITPDSFSDGGKYLDPEAALARAREMEAQGADIIDVGGESTRPGHTPVGAEEELARVLPVLERLVRAVRIPISIDTSKAEVARRALEVGVHMVNDQWALADQGMAEVVAEAGVPVVLMHNQDGTAYRDLLGDITAYFRERIKRASLAGIAREKIIIDPGFGFGKTAAQNLEVVRRLREFAGLGHPILIGPSRKSTIGKVLGLPVEERVEGTAAVVTAAILQGADIVRVHDVKEMVRVARMADAIVRG
ncbi:MAG: dihydropteroate synthase [Desulfotomaculales bacterium]